MANCFPETHFLQVHRSYIVNLNQVKAIEGNMLKVGEHKIPVARNQREQVFDTILNKRLILRK